MLYSRRRMPESPRFQAWVRNDERGAAQSLASYSDRTLVASSNGKAVQSLKLSFGQCISNRRLMLTLLGTAGTWFVFDYA